MNYKTVTKIITILLIIATILGAVSMVFADSIEIPGGTNTGISGTGLDTTAKNIIGIVQFVCYAAAVILLVILGVKWISAAPDAKADIKKSAVIKADIKKSAVIYVVGAALVFAAGAILQVIRNVMEKTIQKQ